MSFRVGNMFYRKFDDMSLFWEVHLLLDLCEDLSLDLPVVKRK